MLSETAANLRAKGPQQDEQYREKRVRFLWHKAQTATLYEDQSGLDVTEPEQRMPLCMEEVPAHHSSLSRGTNSGTGLPLVSAVGFGVKPHQPENCISPG